MKVSQAAMDEVRTVRLADEEELRRNKLASLTRMVNCCATCNYWQGWFDNMFCGKHEIETKPYLICDDYRKET